MTRFSRIGGTLGAWAVGVLFLAGLLEAQDISVVYLGVGGQATSKAVAVNNKGQVVGWMSDTLSYPPQTAQTFLVNPKDADGDGEPAKWFEDLNGDGLNDLMINLTPNERKCIPIKINENGQVLIKSEVDPYTVRFYLITPKDTNGDNRPDTWFENDGSGHNALMSAIRPLGGDHLEAFALNDLGQVVGGCSTGRDEIHAFLWSRDTGTIDLGTLDPGYSGYAMDINNRGEVAGFCMIMFSSYRSFKLTPIDSDSDGVPDRWFRPDENGMNTLMLELRGLGGGFDEAWAINESGQVVGSGYDTADVLHPLLWSGTGAPLDLGTTGGGYSEATAINDLGQVVGYGEEDVDPWDDRPFFWSEDNGFQILDKTDWGWTYAWAINNLGQVVCSDELYELPFRVHAMKMWLYNRGFLWSEELGRIDFVGLDGITDQCYPVAINDHGVIAGASGSASLGKYMCAVIWIIANTGAGSDVPVTPVDPGTGESPVTLVFDEVTEPGDTTLTVSPQGTPPPNGFRLGTPPHYYVIETTAIYSGPITICINYAGVVFGNDDHIALFHNASGHWDEIPSTVYPETQTVCGVVTSLSEFALFELDVRAEGLQSPLAELVQIGQEVPLPDVAFKLGRTLPLKLRLFAGDMLLTNAEVAPPKIVSLARSGEAIALDTLDLDTGEANDNGMLFRFDDGLWIYNLSTKGLLKGTYTITLELPDGGHVCTGFVLR